MLAHLREAQSPRDPRKFLEGVFLGTAACVLLYTAFALALVRLHAGLLGSQMRLLASAGMLPLIQPDDPCLTAIQHQLGSALLIGAPLGITAALLAATASLLPWLRGSPARKMDVTAALMLVPLYVVLAYSRQRPSLSFLCAILTPLFFFVPWVRVTARSGAVRRSPLRLVLLAVVVLLPWLALREASPIAVRDSLLGLPLAGRINDFYYDHTLLAAQVIKPLRSQAQKALVVSPEVEMPASVLHGTLWMRHPTPCLVAGSSLVVSTRPLDCPGLVIPGPGSADPRQDLIWRGSRQFDGNPAVRRGIRFFFHGPATVLVALGLVWAILVVEELSRRRKAAAALILMVLLLPAARARVERRAISTLETEPNRVHEYASSSSSIRRAVSLLSQAERLSLEELRKLAADPCPRVRHHALIRIGERRDPGMLDVLRAGLDDPEPIVRTKACQALGETGGEEARRLLDRTLDQDPSWYVRDYAYRARGRIGPLYRIIDVAGVSGAPEPRGARGPEG